MKTKLLFSSLCACAALLLGAGCRTMTPEQKASLVQLTATEAAYVGVSYDLQAHPDRRVFYASTVEGLKALAAREQFNPVDFQTALANVPALKGSQGAILIEAGVVLYIVGTGYVDLNSAPLAKAALRGTILGMQQALDSTAGPNGVAAALRHPLPKQCELPPRK